MGWLGSTASARLRKLEEVLSMAAVARELRTAEGVESQQVWRPFIIASVWEAGALPYAWASRLSPWQTLLLRQSVRPHAIFAAVRELVLHTLGSAFADGGGSGGSSRRGSEVSSGGSASVETSAETSTECDSSPVGSSYSEAMPSYMPPSAVVKVASIGSLISELAPIRPMLLLLPPDPHTCALVASDLPRPSGSARCRGDAATRLKAARALAERRV